MGVRDEQFPAGVRSGALSHGAGRRAVPLGARSLAVPGGRGCRELAPLGHRLRHTGAARPMSEGDDQLHSSPAAAGIAEEFQLVR